MRERSARRLATALFAALVSLLAFHHEMWRDEVRAFSVAIRNPSWPSLVSELHHEGHPILWYAVLRVGYALTSSNLVLPVTALLIGIFTAWVILRYAPYPLWLRLLAVFGAFLGYELTVNARNYGIGVLLMICACIAFNRRRERPLLVGVCLALMANTSVHAAIAASILLGVWLLDLARSEDRRALLSLQAMGSIVIVAGAVAIAMWSAMPTPDMAWAVSGFTLTPGKILRTITMDPGAGLRGVGDLAAAGELPWRALPGSLDFPRMIVNVALLWLAWTLRRDWRSLVAVVVTILAFEILFRNVYSAGLRHEGVVLFLLFAIGWIGALRARERGDELAGRSIAIGLLPLFVFQTLALPVLANRYISHRESNSKAFGEFILSNPKYSAAILMAEPDYMMESMPYYVNNGVFMPRQREFHWRVYFDKGQKRQAVMSLDDISKIADSVSCAHQVPVLLAIADRYFEYRSAGQDTPNYKGTVFYWTKGQWESFQRRYPRVAEFPYATSDEIYRIHEVNCATAHKTH